MRMVPLLTEAELITLMRDRHGVGFRIMNEAEAESCVRREGNWLRVISKIITDFSCYLADGFGGGWQILSVILKQVIVLYVRCCDSVPEFLHPVQFSGWDIFVSRELLLLLCHPSDT